MYDLVDSYTDKQWRTIQNVASQIAGRKPKRSHYHLNVPREMQDRRRQSPFKDIAHSDRTQVRDWIKEDGDHSNHASMTGGSLSNALRHTLHVAHHVYRRDVRSHVENHRQGGNVFDDIGSAIQDAPKGLKRIGDTLEGTGRALGVQADIMGDKFLNEVGIRKHKKYQSADVDDKMRLHARFAKEVYKDERGDVDGYKYLAEDSTKDYGVFEKDGKAMMVFRGTDPKKALKNNDLIDDARIATGTTLELATNKSAKDKINELLDRYGDHNVDTSGYSLGGGRQLQLLNDSSIYKRLGDENYSLAPGLTAMNANLKKYSSYDKMHYVYAHNDAVANSLLAYKNDNHSVFYDYTDPLKAHLFLDDLAK